MTEKNQRDSFIFYRSFYESIKDLDKNQKAEVLEAICSYALDEYTEPLSGVSKGFFTLIKPQLDANRKRFENGSKPKQSLSKTKAENKQTISKIEANKNDNVNDNVNDNDYKKNNIKKDVDNSAIKENLTVQQNVDNKPNIDRSQNAVFIEKNENNVDIVYNKTSDPQFINYNTGLPAIILDEPADVVVEKIANFIENDIIDSQPMVQQAYCGAGIAVFNDGQNGFGSLLNKNADLWLKSDILMELRRYHKNSQDNIITICQEKKITYQQLYNVFYDTMYKKKQDILNKKELLPLNYFIKVLQSFNQLTSNQNDNNFQRDTNNRGGGKQNEPSIERYFSAGTTINYGTGAEGLRAIAEAHYK
jgi:hypothetical protein